MPRAELIRSCRHQTSSNLRAFHRHVDDILIEAALVFRALSPSGRGAQDQALNYPVLTARSMQNASRNASHVEQVGSYWLDQRLRVAPDATGLEQFNVK